MYLDSIDQQLVNAPKCVNSSYPHELIQLSQDELHG